MDYTDATRALDKLRQQTDILMQMGDRTADAEPTSTQLDLMVQQAKRVRRTTNLLVRHLAVLRDQL